ncbi:TPA: hypothetical protein ACSP2Q_000096 [Aeromonas veronii]
MIHLSAIEAGRLLGKHPKAKAVANQVKKSRQVDELHCKVLAQLVGFPDPATELVFHPKRRWRLDYAWPTRMIAVEIHGGIHSGGRHTLNEAALLGWTVIEVTPEHVKSGQLRAWLLTAFNQDQDQRTNP